METEIEIIITDDKVLYRDAIKDTLKPYPAITVIAEANNGEELLILLSSKKPHIVLLDLEMPVMDGNQAFKIIREQFPDIKIIILSTHYDNVLIENYIERGAKGYIPKDAVMGKTNRLVDAMRKVMAGGIYVFELPGTKINFTSRQKEIMPRIFENKTNEQIASELGLTTRAVEKQRHNLYEKVGANNAIDFYKHVFSKGFQYLSAVYQKKVNWLRRKKK